MSITYNNLCDIQYIYRATSGGTVFSDNLKDDIAFDLFDDDAVVDDCIYFGFKSPRLWFKGLNFYIGTAFTCTSKTLAWEYYANNSTWMALPNIIDDTNNLTNLGENEVNWDTITTKPRTWNINGQNCDWVRVRISAINTPTEGGAQSTQRIQARDGGITISNPGAVVEEFCEACYDADVVGSWGVVSKMGTQSYYFNCHIFIGFANDTDVTTIKDNSKFIEIDGLVWAKKANSKIELGTLISEDDKSTKDGCAIKGNRILSSYFSDSSGLLTKVYNCFLDFSFYTLGVNYNSIIQTVGFCGQSEAGYGPRWVNTLIGSTLSVGSASCYTDASIIRPVIYNKAGAKAIRVAHAIYVVNPIILDAQYIGYCDSNSGEYDSVIIDAETDTWDWYWGATLVGRGPKISRCYTFNLKITDEAGNNIDGAKVELKDINNNNAFYIETGRIITTMSQGELDDFRPSVDGYNIGDYAKVGCEIVKIVSGSYSTFTVDRGQLGTDDNLQNSRQLFKNHLYLNSDTNGVISETVIETNNYKNESGSLPGITAETDYNPFTLTIKKKGYDTYKKTVTIDDKIDWVIRLKRSKINIDQGVI